MTSARERAILLGLVCELAESLGACARDLIDAGQQASGAEYAAQAATVREMARTWDEDVPKDLAGG